MQKTKKIGLSSLIILAALGLAYIPIPGLETKITIVSGTELTESLEYLEGEFEKKYPDIKVEIKGQGSRDIIDNFIDEKNDFTPTILIPADGELLVRVKTRFPGGDPFSDPPQPVAKTLLVAIAWPERGKALFPDGRFRWERIERAMRAKNWQAIGGPQEWGSFDFLMSDPTRSHSGQVTLALWSQSLGGNLSAPVVADLVKTVKQSVYQPPRSTDILLQEFIARGPNEVDIATVYESVALYRQSQSKANQQAPYSVYYPDPTTEITVTAAIVRRDVSDRQREAARKFLDFLREKDTQRVFIRYGFRPVVPGMDIRSVPDNPWSQNQRGVDIDPPATRLPSPDHLTQEEIQRLWERSD